MQLARQSRSHAIDIAVAASAVIHAGLLLLFSQATPPLSADFDDLREVSFMDITYRPEVARILKPPTAGGGGAADPAAVPTYASGVAAEEVPAIDLNATLERDPAQAAIDLDGLELERGEGLDVIQLGGKGSGMSTDEILAQPKVALARGLSRQGGSGTGDLRGYPGIPRPQAQLKIERAALAKPAARELPQPIADLPQVTAAPSKGTDFMVAGPISERKIIRKVTPRYPKWALERRVSGTVVIRLWVAPGGNVKGMPSIETSSGYPDLDQVVVDALRNWEFAPLGSDVKSEDQWGVVTFRFTLT